MFNSKEVFLNVDKRFKNLAIWTCCCTPANLPDWIAILTNFAQTKNDYLAIGFADLYWIQQLKTKLSHEYLRTLFW